MLIAFCPLEMMRCELRAIDRGDFGSVRPGEGVLLDWWSHPVIPVASPNSGPMELRIVRVTGPGWWVQLFKESWTDRSVRPLQVPAGVRARTARPAQR
jgi:hypothetical protein